ncbi:ABC transporter permease [Nocardiopsis trehalosi]|uniref:ABC transporter permease n=1 Tax=Nocardiopsis trehalosi TaxID=109329 RepID=UPI000B2FA299|nr:ABC transporter permease [Nocardiopsis trehalosi]
MTASGRRRIAALDVLRGFALCGILLANIQLIANADTSVEAPPLGGAHVWIGLPIFSLLFGIGFALLLDSAAERAPRPRLVLLRRLLALLGFGLPHMLLWRGEILTVYAVVGLLVLLPASWLPRWAVAGLAAAAVPTALVAGGGGPLLIAGLFLLGSALVRYGVVDRIERSTWWPALLGTAFAAGAAGAGLAGPGGGRGEYLAYVTPAILLMTVASVSVATAVWVASDMTTGIVTRLRTMAVSRVALLAGHVLGALVQTALAVAIVLGVALLLGFRSPAGPAAWAAFAAVLAMATFAVTWLTVALGLAAKTVETASNTPMLLLLLPFLGSGFVATDSMPAWLRWFAEYQPFTPIIDTLRGLLTAEPVGPSAALATGWCVLITAASLLWARHLFATRSPA